MPQVDIASFHSLTITTFILIFFFFSFVYYYLTPFWSVLLKLGVKKNLISFFLIKTTKTIFISDKLLNFQKSLIKAQRNTSNLL